MKHLVIYTVLFIPVLLYCQEKTYKEIKTMGQTIDCRSGDKFNINGERTFLKLRSWDNDKVQLKVQVVSKHKDQDQARSDLDKIEIIFDKKSKQITYSNSIKIDNPKDKPQSNLKVILEIKVPEYLELEIMNKFGEIDIQGKYHSLESSSQFTNIAVSDFNSKAKFTTEYGDAALKNCRGDIMLTADRSDLLLDNVSSVLDLEIAYGELEMHLVDVVRRQKVEAQFSPIRIYITDKLENSISLNCSNCNIEHSEKIDIDHGETSKGNQSARISGSREELSVTSEIEDIRILLSNELTNIK